MGACADWEDEIGKWVVSTKYILQLLSFWFSSPMETIIDDTVVSLAMGQRCSSGHDPSDFRHINLLFWPARIVPSRGAGWEPDSFKSQSQINPSTALWKTGESLRLRCVLHCANFDLHWAKVVCEKFSLQAPEWPFFTTTPHSTIIPANNSTQDSYWRLLAHI